MIDGRILITNITIDRWVQEAIETDVERRTLMAEAEDSFERHFAYSSPTGRRRIESLLDEHCEAWCFGPEDRRRIATVVLSIYEEARKFLEL